MNRQHVEPKKKPFDKKRRMNKSKNIAAESMFDVFVGLKPMLIIFVAFYILASIIIDVPENSPFSYILGQLLHPVFVLIVVVTALTPCYFLGGWPTSRQFAKALVQSLISLIFLFAVLYLGGPKHAFLAFLAWFFLLIPGAVWWTNLIFRRIVWRD